MKPENENEFSRREFALGLLAGSAGAGAGAIIGAGLAPDSPSVGETRPDGPGRHLECPRSDREGVGRARAPEGIIRLTVSLRASEAETLVYYAKRRGHTSVHDCAVAAIEIWNRNQIIRDVSSRVNIRRWAEYRAGMSLVDEVT